uniref:B box-type domain-containing protein n=2 Tax=Steinernema glaseri TaxID=37863 RepID=A0A1I7YHR2_9BILA
MFNVSMDEELPCLTLPEPTNEVHPCRRYPYEIMNGLTDVPFEDQMLERDQELCNECNENKVAYMICVSCVTLLCESCHEVHLQKKTCKGDTKRFIDWDLLFRAPPSCEIHPGNVCTTFCNRCLAFTCEACIKMDGLWNENCRGHLAASAGMYRELQQKAKMANREALFWIETLYNVQGDVEARLKEFADAPRSDDPVELQKLLMKQEVFVNATNKVREASKHLVSCKEFADEYDQRDEISVADLLKIVQILDLDHTRDYLNNVVQNALYQLDHVHFVDQLPNVVDAPEREPLQREGLLTFGGNNMLRGVAYSDELAEQTSRLMVVDRRSRSVCDIRRLS